MNRLIAIATFAVCASFVSAAPMYRVTDLHTTDQTELTDNGSVYVIRRVSSANQDITLYRDGKWTKPALPGDAFVRDVSDNGTLLVASAGRVFVQSPAGVRRTLVRAAGSDASYPVRVNDAGTAFGAARYGERASLAVWTTSTATLSKTPLYSLSAVNNVGAALITPTSWQSSDRTISVWAKGKSTRLPSPAGSDAWGIDLNDRGTVIGTNNDFADNNALSRGVIWQKGRYRAVAPLPGDSNLLPVALNDNDVFVGGSNGQNDERAVLWDGSKLIDLNTRVAKAGGVHFYRGFDINDAGQILTSGNVNGRWSTYLLTPVGGTIGTAVGRDLPVSPTVPEPAAGFVLPVLAGLVLRRRRGSAVK